MRAIRTTGNDNTKPDGVSSRLLTECMLAAFASALGKKPGFGRVGWSIAQDGQTWKARTGTLFPTDSDGTFRAEADLTRIPDGDFRLDVVRVFRDPDLFDPNGRSGVWLPSPVNMLSVHAPGPEPDPDLEALVSDAEALVSGLSARPRTLRTLEALGSLEKALRDMCARSCAEAMGTRTLQFTHGGKLHAAEPGPDGAMAISSSDGKRASFADSDTGLCLAALRAALKNARYSFE